MKIEVLVVPDCPHEKAAVELLRRALDDVGLTDVTWDTQVVADQDEAERIGFTGSPTFLIDGRDLFAEPGRAAGLTCRMYATPQGPAGLPTLDQLRQALAAVCQTGNAPAGPGSGREPTNEQRRHWQDTHAAHPGMYGAEPSTPAVHAAGVFRAAGADRVLELGAGHGRDALYFARKGFTVRATDFSSTGLGQLREAARAQGLADRITTAVHDVRTPLPLPDDSVDAVFAHMLLCMALSTREIRTLVAEVRRVLRPGGVFVYTVRHTGDAHYGTGTAHGDDIYEHGGFAVHFFPRQLVDSLADGWRLDEVHGFEEGELPRRLWRITQSLS
ncbi:hypothetical protein GCM10010211_65740 [Streptomyces albospinus]|uniref:Methyltransferase domain-containing protein n=1 Tax=Streptomyces albospinus TaxID=285515 RepID=A0ABQ2VJH7_9ACTN|nr:methyltransferase domain-containing protein [Streptomyces albospinus]GGU90026.1 hypothetical protein GCM10010211_65740 [Streptomyces albospinus]